VVVSDAFARFRAAVLDDESLQERLRAIADWQTFIAASVAAAAELGIQLTPDELDDARRQALHHWRDRWV
jgi:Nif11 domain